MSLLSTIAQFNGDMSTMLSPLGEYQYVGEYLRDRDIAPQLKEATTAWCSLAQVSYFWKPLRALVTTPRLPSNYYVNGIPWSGYQKSIVDYGGVILQIQTCR